jgi:hypothetical protein
VDWIYVILDRVQSVVGSGEHGEHGNEPHVGSIRGRKFLD